MEIRERDMAKSAKSTAHKSKYQPEQDEKAGKQLNDLISFFHSDVLHSFISMTVLRTLLLLILIVLGYPVARAATLTGFCCATVRKKKALFEDGEIKKIFTRKPGSGRKGKCASKQDEIIEELESHDYRSAKQILKMIQEKLGASVSLSAVKEFLHKLGFKCLKCGSLPAKADHEAQRAFNEDSMTRLRNLSWRGRRKGKSYCALGMQHILSWETCTSGTSGAEFGVSCQHTLVGCATMSSAR